MTREDELRAIGAGDCPRHGRYYGICHSCAKAQSKQVDLDSWNLLIKDNAILALEIDRLREFIEGIYMDTSTGMPAAWNDEKSWYESQLRGVIGRAARFAESWKK